MDNTYIKMLDQYLKKKLELQNGFFEFLFLTVSKMFTFLVFKTQT